MMRQSNGCPFCGAQGPDPDRSPARLYAALAERNRHLPAARDVLRFEIVGDADEPETTITVTMAVRMP